MIIQSLKLQNFRRFQSQKFVFNPRFTVLVGRNATGKTQILDALAIVLGTYLTKIFRRKTAFRKIAKKEIRCVYHAFSNDSSEIEYRREEQYPVELDAQILFRGQTFTQSCYLGSKTGKTSFGGHTPFLSLAEDDADCVSRGKEVSLPLLAYYGAGRLWPLKRHFDLTPSRLEGYEDSLDPKSDIKGLESWIKKQEIISLQKKVTTTSLELVRQAMIAMIPNCKMLYYDVELDCINIVFTNEEQCPFQNLSDGFRCMVSLVADITRRIITMNPHLGRNALLETEGVVLIDEIDLHLHPEWQRRVVDDLKKVFPKLQFIATTHSPFIIQSLQPGELIDLEQCDIFKNKVNHYNPTQRDWSNQSNESFGEREIYNENEDNDICFNPIEGSSVAWPGPADQYKGRSIEDIVESIMGITVPQRSERFQRMYDTAKKYFSMLHQESHNTPEEKEKLKRQLDELIAPFSDDVAYHAFLEMERLASFAKEKKE